MGDGREAMQMKRRALNDRRGEGENNCSKCLFGGAAAEVRLRTPFFWDSTLPQ
jgi:hypothetical protein